jgi:hypothetical protein
MAEDYYLFTEAFEHVSDALFGPNTKLIRSGDFHPCHGNYIRFIHINGLSSTLLLPCNPSCMKPKLTRVLQGQKPSQHNNNFSIPSDIIPLTETN